MEVLTEENINPAFKRIQYDIRGWLEDRAHGIRQELARVSIKIFDDFDIYPVGVRMSRSERHLSVFFSCLFTAC